MISTIQIYPNICHGNPVIRGTRVLVSQDIQEMMFTRRLLSRATLRVLKPPHTTKHWYNQTCHAFNR